MATEPQKRDGVDIEMFESLVIDTILAGDVPVECLEHIAEACWAQRAVQARKDSLSLRYDDRVKVKSNVSPKYLRGATGTFKGRDGARLLVLMDSHWHHKISGKEWRMSAGSIEKVEVPATTPVTEQL